MGGVRSPSWCEANTYSRVAQSVRASDCLMAALDRNVH